MSRSSKGFADFFPTAPSVLQQKRFKASQDRRIHRSPSAGFSQASHSVPRVSASSDREANGGIAVAGPSNGEVNTLPPSLMQEESDCVNADIAHEVGSASSASTASSIFSAGQREINMAYQQGPHKSTSLTPLTNIDSSPRANGIGSPRKRPIYDQHLSSTNPPKSPSSSHVSDSRGSGPDLISPSSRSQARPGIGEIKGFKAIYDPLLDKNLRGSEKKSRQVQYAPFGEEVRFGLSI